MFGHQSTRQIDLHLPTGWNRCTTEELEAIAAAIIHEQQRVDRYHPFDWSRVKLNVVLAVNSIEVVSQPVPVVKNYSHDDTYLVRRPKDEEPWPITVGQLVALTERLAWIDDEKASKTIFQFPYPTLDVRWKREDGRWKKEDVRAISHHTSNIIHLQGPSPLLDGYTWQEYRWMTDWMQAYMRNSNAILLMNNEELIMKNREAMENARNEFLAVLFKPKAPDGKTADHTSAINHLTSDIFTDFSPVKWQVILFWWSSLMSMLAKKFPKVFKQQPVGKDKRRPQQQDTPWDFYNRVTATIQKYIGGLSEQDVNNATYGTILQQLEMMADEAAEMEKIKKK